MVAPEMQGPKTACYMIEKGGRNGRENWAGKWAGKGGGRVIYGTSDMDEAAMTDALGWAASAVVVSSYFFRDPKTLRRVQAFGAVIWTAYGVALGALPIIVVNNIVTAAALWSSFRRAEKGVV